jgi:hypothetical protein
VEWVKGSPPPRKSWKKLSEQFHRAETSAAGIAEERKSR